MNTYVLRFKENLKVFLSSRIPTSYCHLSMKVICEKRKNESQKNRSDVYLMIIGKYFVSST